MVFNTQERTKRNSRGYPGGFTLVEILLALGILGLLLTAIYRVYISQESMFRAQEQITKTQQNLRATTEFLNQEMAWMGYQSTGTAVLYAATDEIVFNANIPNIGTPVRYVRYRHDAEDDTLERAVGSTLSYVQNDSNMQVLASNIEFTNFTYYDGARAAMALTTTPLQTPADDVALSLIRYVRAKITAKSPQPDWNYSGHSDHYRRRSAEIEIKLRNIEDISVSEAGGLGTGLCSSFIMDLTYPGVSGQYEACSDHVAYDPETETVPNLTDNPIVTVTVSSPAGSPQNDATVALFASNGFIFTDDSGSSSVISNWTDGVASRYVVANDGSNVSEGTIVEVVALFTPPEPGCVQLSHSETLTVISGSAAYFDTGSPYETGILMEHVNLDTSVVLDPQPTLLPVCSSQARQGVRMTVRLVDQCGNGIEGENVQFAATTGTFQGSTKDVGDGTYEIVYLPPDNLSSVVPSEWATLTATWGTETLTASVPLVPGSPADIVVESIEKTTSPPEFQFVSSVAPENGSQFSIERVDGQWVTIDYYVADACGNRVFDELPDITITEDSGLHDALSEDPATALHTFYWKSDEGCGHPMTNQILTIRDDTLTETVTYNLLQTETGPMVVVETSSPLLVAGDTSDNTEVTARIMEYDEDAALCVNVPGPFPMEFNVQNDVPADGNGTFEGPLADKTIINDPPETTDSNGYATVSLWPYDADAGNTLTVTAVADVEGVTFSGNTTVDLAASNPDYRTGFFTDSLYTEQMGPLYSVKAYDPDDTIYVQVQDYDENKSPLYVDEPMAAPLLSVTLVSERTGDVERVFLEESGGNTTLFRGSIPTELSAAAVSFNDTLQILHGDMVSMTYEDRDDYSPDPNSPYNIYISGPRSLELYLVNGSEIPIFSGSTQVADVDYGDRIRPKLYVPQYDSDSSSGTTTLTLLVSSGTDGDEDIVNLREQTDTGVFVPDSLVYGGNDFFVTTKTDPTDDTHLLRIPYTPKTVTVTYPDSGLPIEELTFAMSDHDLPTVEIVAPSDGSVVGSVVDISIFAEDTNNYTATAGISRIDVYIDGFLFHTWTGTPDLTGTHTVPWTTAIGPIPLWLDGDHTVFARAEDFAGNIGETAHITVTVDNNLQAIEWTSPGSMTVWSQTVPVEVMVAELDTSTMSYEVTLSIDGNDCPLEDLGGGAWGYSWDSSGTPDGTVTFIAQVKDTENNKVEIFLDVIVDHTQPSISVGAVPEWLNASDFPLVADLFVTDTNGVDPDSVTGEFTGAASSGLIPMAFIGADTYRLEWAGPSSAVDGSITIEIIADDLATPPNTASETKTTSIDTLYPEMAPITASPIQSLSFTLGGYTVAGFVSAVDGDVTVSSRVMDNYPDLGSMAFQFFTDPWHGWPESWTDPVVFGSIDASGTGDFSYTWETDGEYLPAQSWDPGLYVVTAEGTDLAGNAASPVTSVYYLDNQEPGSWAWVMSWPVWGSKYVSIEGDANYGFVKSLQAVIVPQGGTPGEDDVASSAVIPVDLSAKAHWYQTSWLWDTTAIQDGAYEIYATAEDWAGNVSGPSPNPIEVFNKYMDNVTAVFDTTGPGANMTLSGQIEHPLGITEAIEFDCEVTRHDSLGTVLAGPTYYPVTTDASGSFVFGVPAGLFQFDPGDLFMVRFYSQPNYYWYGELEGVVQGVQGWTGPMEFDTLDYSFGPIGPGTYDSLTLDGTLVFANGDPAVFESIRVTLDHQDHLSNWYWTEYELSTDGSGVFSLVIPYLDPNLGGEYFYDGDEIWVGIRDWNWNMLGELNGQVPTLMRRN